MKEKITKTIVILLITAAVTLVLSNLQAIGTVFSGTKRTEIDLEEKVGKSTVTVKDERVTIKDIDAEMYSITLTTEGDFAYKNVTVTFTDDNFRFDDAHKYNKVKQLIRTGGGMSDTISVSSYGKVGEIGIESDGKLKITGITLNAPPKFSFSLLLFLLLSLGACTVYFGTWKETLGEGDKIYIYALGLALCLMMLSSAFVIKSACGLPLLTELPENVTKEDEYVQLFDAFHKGQLDLDIDYSVDKLEKLDNPYDRSERNKNHLHGAIWDRAYYNGKFYSYFGPAPVFTVYYPVYILTGKIPTPLYASVLMCVGDIIAITLLYALLITKFCRDVPRELALVGLAAVVFGSAIPAAASEAQFYFMAVMSGVGWTAMFLYLILSAYYSESFRRRTVFLALAGVSVVMIAASRPTLLLYCFTAIVPAVYIFKNKSETVRNRVVYLAAIGVPVIAGAVILMVYNYARFENPFEFGFNYQLTVSRAQANTIKLSLIPAAIYHFFVQQPIFISSFPYMKIERNSLDSYTRYSYTGVTMGVFSYPLTWALAFLPCLRRSGKDAHKFKFDMIASLTAAALVMAFIDMCKAGMHYRYTVDILFILTMIAVVMTFRAMRDIKKRLPDLYATFYAAAALAMTATIIIGGVLIFANEGNTMIEDFAPATEFFRSIL